MSITGRKIWRVVASAIVLALVIHCILVFSGVRQAGDFPEFFGVASLVSAGRCSEIYSHSALAEAQAPFFLAGQGGHIFFAYPPAVAVLLAPLTKLSYSSAYLSVVVGLIGCVVVAVRVLQRLELAPGGLSSFGLALCLYPLIRSIAGAQNTAISLLISVAMMSAGHTNRPFLCGVFAGLMLFKPSFAPLALLFAWILCGWRMLPGVVLVALGWWLLGYHCAGAGWLAWYVERGIFESAQHDFAANAPSFVSIAGVARRSLGISAASSLALSAVGLGLASVVLFRLYKSGSSNARVLALYPVLLVLFAPQAMFYDAGLALPALLLIAKQQSGRQLAMLLTCLSWLEPLTHVVPLQPLIVWLGLMWWLIASVDSTADSRRIV